MRISDWSSDVCSSDLTSAAETRWGNGLPQPHCFYHDRGRVPLCEDRRRYSGSRQRFCPTLAGLSEYEREGYRLRRYRDRHLERRCRRLCPIAPVPWPELRNDQL